MNSEASKNLEERGDKKYCKEWYVEHKVEYYNRI